MFAAVHIDLEDHERVARVMAELRRERKLTPHYYFKFKSSSDAIKRSFFEAMIQTPVSATVMVVDKFDLPKNWFTETRGSQRIVKLISQLICQIPDELIGNQLVSIDIPTSEGALLRELRKAIRVELAGNQRLAPKRLKALQDDRDDGFPIQIADMIAGQIHSESQTESRYDYAELFRNKLTIVST